ncbi:hypothetical protein [Paenibacillus silvae]|uniref:hypothetical protein n=1 Tax=Paenibacillus silvae TaxID=1325358 RepID=UPI003D001FAC|nr:hypothetical protein [Paenibacillus silvae]
MRSNSLFSCSRFIYIIIPKRQVGSFSVHIIISYLQHFRFGLVMMHLSQTNMNQKKKPPHTAAKLLPLFRLTPYFMPT